MPELTDVLATWLEKQLLEDQYARLEQAGHSAEGKIPLARVFLDIEATQSPNVEPREKAEPDELRPGFIAELLGVEPGSLTLPAASKGTAVLNERPVAPGPAASPVERKQGHYLLIGGPGQGKSTLTQYLCQLHRTALLATRADRLSSAGRTVLRATQQQGEKDQLVIRAQVCLPIRIVLGELAAWVAKNGVDPEQAVLCFLAEHIRKRTGQDMAVDDLRSSLVAFPLLLVLDGLDEVPASGGRGPMMDAVRAFRTELANAGAQGLVIATTRPQGDTGDFEAFEKRWLSPLSRARALNYARRLVAVRYWDQEDRREKIQDRLEEAFQDDSTARLMQSPLQVTIMAALVDRMGRAPRERWRLFDEYYKLIYYREMERPTPLADLLRKERSHIDAIHRQVGLLLQVESERLGGTEARMTRARLEEVIEARLAEEHFDEGRRKELTRNILDAATERLVFLVSLEEDTFGFEIRSLQEFMAAEALTSGADESVRERLRQIARAVAWRNVLLFAASKCFSQIEHLQGAIVELCEELNEDATDEVARLTLAGSRLALELLDEGSVLHYPRHAKRLAGIAARLLALPPADCHLQLAIAFVQLAAANDMEAVGVLKAEIRKRLSDGPFAGSLGSWVTLIALVDVSSGNENDEEESTRPDGEENGNSLVDNPLAFAEAHWPSEGLQQQQVVEAFNKGGWLVDSWLQEKMASSPEVFSPLFMQSIDLDTEAKGTSSSLFSAWFVSARTLSEKPELTPWLKVALVAEAPDESVMELAFSPVDSGGSAIWSDLAAMESPPPAWLPLVAAARFASAPSASALARELRAVAGQWDSGGAKWAAIHAPWPLGACLRAAEASSDLERFAELAEQGELGDFEDWRSAEHRWRSTGIRLTDFRCLDGGGPFFDRGIASEGAPLWVALMRYTVAPEDAQRWFHLFLELHDKMSTERGRALVAGLAMGMLGFVASHGFTLRHRVSSQRFKRLFDSLPAMPFPLNAICALSIHQDEDPGWADVLEQIGTTGRGVVYSVNRDEIAILVRHVSRCFVKEPHRRALLNLLSVLLAAGGEAVIPAELLIDEQLDTQEIRDGTLLIRIAQGGGSADDVHLWVKRFVEIPNPVRALVFQTTMALLRSAEPSARERFLIDLRSNTLPEDWDLHAEIVEHLTELWKSRPSHLEDAAVWDQLTLRLPRPQALSLQRDPLGTTPGIVRIDSILIKNLRSFEDLRLDFHASSSDNGQWVVLLGENGVGKSTLLRALTFALSDSKIVAGLLAASTASFRRHDAPAGECVVTLQGHPFRAEIRAESEREIARQSSDDKARRPFLFAYGCRRGSALGGAKREVAFNDVSEVITLFDESEGLLHAETWLTKLRLGAELKGKDQESKKAIFDSVMTVLQKLLPGVDSIDVRDDHVWLSGPGIGHAPLAALSDGYLTTIGWVLDLIARWIHRAERLGLPIGNDFTKTMDGLVLVDELDLHLHPRWQLHVINDLRELFPRLSFVVTTHNPLTLLGARDGEIWVIRRTGDADRIKVEQIDLPPGQRADQVLTGPWFNLLSTLDEDTLERLEEHRMMLRAGVPESDERRKALEALLRQRLGMFAETSLERLALSVAAEILDEMAKSYRALSPEDRDLLRERLKARVKARQGGAGVSSGTAE